MNGKQPASLVFGIPIALREFPFSIENRQKFTRLPRVTHLGLTQNAAYQPFPAPEILVGLLKQLLIGEENLN